MRSLRRAERESVPAGGGSSPPLPGGPGPYARPALRPVCGLKPAALQDGRERVTPAPNKFRPRKRVAGVELWRSLATASAVVGRREASARRSARAAARRLRPWTTRLSAFRFLTFFRSFLGMLKARIVRCRCPPPVFSDEDRCGERKNSRGVTMTRVLIAPRERKGLRHCERSEAIRRSMQAAPGLLRR